jgi:exodeoxyribonuclease VII large subunit
MNGQLTLQELNTRIRNAIQDAFPETVWVVAEISELKENRSGHCYLELIEKDEATDDIRARMRATIWSYSYRMLKPYFESTTGQSFSHGIKVLLNVSVEFHPAYGLSLNIKDIDPTYTLGDLVRRRREILRKLTEAGVINMNKDIRLPLVPQRIAVISSATAAGYQDFVNHLETNPHKFHFSHRLFESYMQGTESVPSILRAFDLIFREEENFDAVVIIRGGGATADLSSFDNLDLAFAVAQFPLPVVTGIGHEKDDTVIDLIAHTRLKTPTAVAEFFISGALRFHESLVEKERLLTKAIRTRMEDERENLTSLAEEFSDSVTKFLQSGGTALRKSTQRLQTSVSRYTFSRREELHGYRFRLIKITSGYSQDQLSRLKLTTYRIRNGIQAIFGKSHASLDEKKASLHRIIRNNLSVSSQILAGKEEKLRLLDPRNILQRGFTLTSQNGKILKSTTEVQPGLYLETRFHDGTLISKIFKNK